MSFQTGQLPYFDRLIEKFERGEQELMEAFGRHVHWGYWEDPSFSFREGNACHLPFGNKSFDVVLAVECIFHFPSREDFFRESHRVLKTGGHLALSDFVPRKGISSLFKIGGSSQGILVNSYTPLLTFLRCG